MMLNTFFWGVLCVSSALSLSTPTSVNANRGDIVPNSFIVETESPSTLVKRNSLFLDVPGLLSFHGIAATLRETFDALPEVFHGASVHVPTGVSIADLQQIPGVKRVWPVQRVHLPNPVITDKDASAPRGQPIAANDLAAHVNKSSYALDTFSPHTMTGVNVTHARGLLGKGVRVAVIDSGVDFTNPILGGKFGPGNLVSFGYDLVGNAYNGVNTPVPGGEPFTDCNEHGTHVSGIIAAQSNSYGFSGVAPAVDLGMFRVFGCNGSSADDVILSAVMMAIKAKANIITLSLGGNGGWVDSTAAEILFDHIESQGIAVTVAAGNSGSEGLFFSQAPSSTRKQFSIASVDNKDLTAFNAIISSHGDIPVLSALPLGVGPLKVYFTSSDPNTPNDGCTPLPDSTPDLSGYVTVVQRGVCTFDTKYKTVLAKGGKTVLIYNKAGGTTLPYLATDNTGIDHVGGLTRPDGLRLLALWLADKSITLNFPVGPTVPGITDTISGGLISSFSNFGPTNDLYGQPTLGAPGGNILSTFPLKLGGLGVISGTSMATPFIAGSIAVVMSARKSENLSPLEIRGLLTSTANILPSALNETIALSTVVVQGGGLVQLDRAINTHTFASPFQLLLNDTRYPHYDQTIKITNRNKKALTYTFSSILAEARGVYNASGDNLPASVPSSPSASASVRFAVPKWTVAPGATYELKVRFSPPQLSKDVAALFPIYSGWIKIDGGVDSITVPYFGLAAAVYDMPVLDLTDTVYGPGLTYPFVFDNITSTVQHGPATYTTAQGPILFARLAGGTRSFAVDLVDARLHFTPTAPDIYEAATNGSTIVNATTLSRRATQLNALLPLPELVTGKALIHAHRHKKPKKSHRHHSIIPQSNIRYSDVKIVGNILKETDVYRDNLVGQESGPPYTDTELPFNGTYRLPGSNTTATTDPSKSYRFLLRALKNTGNPIFEAEYESWLSAPFKISK